MSSTEGYRQIMNREYEVRCGRNPRYSLRAFARDLGLSASGLSQILSGRQGLSSSKAERVAQGLGFNPREVDRFKDLVGAEHARSPRDRKLASLRLLKYGTRDQALAMDVFQVISDWYHVAILELSQLEGYVPKASWISKQLGISPRVTQMALQRLVKLGLLSDQKSGYRKTSGHLTGPDGIPSEAIRKFHDQILDKAKIALFEKGAHERDFSNVVFCANSESLEKVRKRIRLFRKEISSELEAEPGRNRVYCLSIQFFDVHPKTPIREGAANP